MVENTISYKVGIGGRFFDLDNAAKVKEVTLWMPQGLLRHCKWVSYDKAICKTIYNFHRAKGIDAVNFSKRKTICLRVVDTIDQSQDARRDPIGSFRTLSAVKRLMHVTY